MFGSGRERERIRVAGATHEGGGWRNTEKGWMGLGKTPQTRLQEGIKLYLKHSNRITWTIRLINLGPAHAPQTEVAPTRQPIRKQQIRVRTNGMQRTGSKVLYSRYPLQQHLRCAVSGRDLKKK